MRNGEEPVHSVIAVHPKHNHVITYAIAQLKEVLSLHMPEEQIVTLQNRRVQMHSGTILELGPFSLFFSLSYPTEPGRIFEMQFGTPPGKTLH